MASKQEINRKCAELLYPDAESYPVDSTGDCSVFRKAENGEIINTGIINIYTDNNQLCDVVDALIIGCFNYRMGWCQQLGDSTKKGGIRQAMINFVENCL